MLIARPNIQLERATSDKNLKKMDLTLDCLPYSARLVALFPVSRAMHEKVYS